MSKQFNNFLLKVLVLSAFIVLAFNIWDNLINANKVSENVVINNQDNSNFKDVSNVSLWKTWVAITTNIWIRYKQRQETPATIYRDIFSISEIVGNPELANQELIWTNMIAVEEYRNVLKTNVKQLLDSSYDKPRFLNAFIEQLEFRYVTWGENIKRLNEQKTVFMNNIANSEASIETLKQKIESDFRANDSKESLNNIDRYLELKEEFYYSRTYVIYINHFLSEYSYLSEYNKLLLDTLINNKEALIKDAFVVIPDSWADLLRSFDLIYSEEEFKQ